MRSIVSLFTVSLLLACPGGGMSTDGGELDGGGEPPVDAGLLPANYSAVGYAVTLQGSKVVAVGIGGRVDDERSPDLFATRLNADLTLDGTFATRGFVSVDLDGGVNGLASFVEDGLYGVIADGDKAVATGYARGVTATPGGAAIIVRFAADGSLDTSFNTRGYALYDFNPMSHIDNLAAGYAVGKRADGKYVFAGGFDNGSRGRDMFAYRLNADGTTDGTFTPMPLHFGGSESANDLVLQGNNVVLGGGEDFPLCRLGNDGMLDLTFGAMGSVKSSGGTMLKLLERPDGRLLAIGNRTIDSNTSALKLFQVTANGAPDTAFGAMGVVEVMSANGMGPAGDIRGAALLANGSLVVLSHNLAGSRLYKLTASGALDTTWGEAGSKPSGLNINILGLITAQPRGSNALTVSGSDAFITGTTLVDVSPGNPRARFALVKVGL